MASPLVCSLLAWLCPTIIVCILTSPVLTIRAPGENSEETAEVLPAPCDFIVDNFNRKLQLTLDSVAPTKTIKTKPLPPWRSKDEIKKSKRLCRIAERRWRKNKLTVHYEIFREQHKSYNKTVLG